MPSRQWKLPGATEDPGLDKFSNEHTADHNEHERLFPETFQNAHGDLSDDEDLIVIAYAGPGGIEECTIGVIVNTTLVASSSDYWDFQWKSYREINGQMEYLKIGPVASTRISTLRAFMSLVDIRNVWLHKGESLILSITKTGSPETLSGLVAFAQPHRRT